MAKYTEEEISQIIIDVERLIEPEEELIDGVPRPIEVKKLQTPKSVILNRYYEETINSEDYFEECFNTAKRKRHSSEIPDAINYAEIFCSAQESSAATVDAKPCPRKVVTINGELKYQLLNFRQNLESMKSSIDDRLKTLEQFLEDLRTAERDSASLKTTYVKCGAPFFKDALGYPAPENEDFKYRKNVLKEFFPFDLPHSSPWEKNEKTQLVQGVKEQMITYIQTQQSKKICQEAKKTRGKMQKIRYIFNNKDLQETALLKLYETIESEYPEFWSDGINWSLISFNSLEGKHTVSECMGMWHSYLRPDVNREPFTDEENALLAHAVVENKHQNWDAIASQLEKRTSLQTFTHYNSERSRLCPPNVRWTPEEDQKLLEAVRLHTRGKDVMWHHVGTALENRNKTQCYNRYIIIMRQKDSKKGVFKPHEDRILLDFVANHGTDFSKMPPNLLPNRSVVQIKNHYNVALKHKGKVNPWTREEDQQLMDFVEKEGTNSWYKIAEMLKTHNRLSCRTRYTTITKFLKKNPGKTVADTPSRLKTVTAVHKAIQSDDEMSDGGGDGNDDSMLSLGEGRAKSFGSRTFDEFKIGSHQLYHLLKTTYNYSLDIRHFDINTPKFLVLKSLLNINDSAMGYKTPYMLTQSQESKLQEVLSFDMDMGVKNEIRSMKQKFNFHMPPNFNTAIGLRAIAIKVNEESVGERNSVKNASEEYKRALQKFQKLFYSLFYWPAMISKLKECELRKSYSITDSRNNTIKIVNYIPNESTQRKACVPMPPTKKARTK